LINGVGLAATQWKDVWWSAINKNNVVDLDAPTPAMAVKMQGADESSSDFGSSSNRDSADSLNFNAA
jgi:hypothetical protein